MAVWNVAIPVIALVEAPTAEDAIKRARRRLEQAGFEIHEGTEDYPPNAFESEDATEAWF
jgi:muramoyltetrapeptide carboxypeptidase LdcA involved in peptidoglycan recycling